MLPDQKKHMNFSEHFMGLDAMNSIIEEEHLDKGDNFVMQKPALNLTDLAWTAESDRKQIKYENFMNNIGQSKHISKKILFHEPSESEDPSPGVSSNKSGQSITSFMSKLREESPFSTIDDDASFNCIITRSLKSTSENQRYVLNLPSLNVRKHGMSLSTTDSERRDALHGFEGVQPSLLEKKSMTKDSSLSIVSPKSALPSNRNLEFSAIEPSTPQSCMMEIETDSFSGSLKNEHNILFENTPSRLPTIINNKNGNIATIASDTLKELLTTNKNKFEFLVIDCRYDYEYQGGHIKDAINITDPMLLERLFITNRELLYRKSYIASLKQDFNSVINSFVSIKNYEDTSTLDSAPIIIFHCEYSLERGPRMLGHLRKIDRDLNFHRYPHLNYPDIYLLADGYRLFHIKYPECCSSSGYIEMKDVRFKTEYSEAHRRDQQYWNKNRQKRGNQA